MKLNKPTKDFKQAGFDNLGRRNSSAFNEYEAFPKQALMAEDVRSIDLIDDRSLRVAFVGTAVMTTANITNPNPGVYVGEVAVLHNEGRVPVYKAFVKRGSETYYQGLPLIIDTPIPSGGSIDHVALWAEIDDKAIRFKLTIVSSLDTPDAPYSFKYYLMEQSIPNE